MSNKDENLLSPAGEPSEDINILQSEGHGVLNSADTGEVLEMVLGNDDLIFGNEDEDDVLIGRMGVGGGGDPADFEVMMPTRYAEDGTNEGYEGDELDLLSGDETPAVFQPPSDEHFPVFKQALRKFQADESKPKTVRIDTEASHDQFMCERAVAEIERRVEQLEHALKDHENDPAAHRALLEAHNADPHAHHIDVMGAAQAVADLHAATDAKSAAAAMPKIPLDLPPYAEGKIRCWKDGEDIVCSIRFAAADGTVRVATMAARPRADSDDVARGALNAGIDPVVVLGALSDLTDVICGKKLVKDVAGAALSAHRRLDVCGMAKDGTDDPSLGDDPLFLTTTGNSGSAPVAAMMHVEQRANAGDPRAKKELHKIKKVAGTARGKAIAPAVAEASKRLAAGQRKKTAVKTTLAQRYANLSLYL